MSAGAGSSRSTGKICGEAACHYSLDGFLNFFIEQLGGKTYIEVPTGRGRVDILIRHRGKSHVIETKLYTASTAFERGKRQLALYLDSEGLEEGFYVVFSRVHSDKDDLFAVEMVEGKRIHTHIVPIDFEAPSKTGAYF